MRRIMLTLGATLALAGAATAQEVRLVFPSSPLGDEDRQLVTALYQQLPSEAGAVPTGAIAVSSSFFEMWGEDPAVAILSGLFQVVGNFETEEDADAAALEACEAAREAGQRRCVIAARILPK